MAAVCNWVSRLLVADCSAVILPASAIDPVLSSTSATRSRLEPHLAVDEPLTVMTPYPMAASMLVGTSVAPLTTTEVPPSVVKLAVTVTFVASGRANKAKKYFWAFVCSCVLVSVAASFEIISAVESSAACIAALTALARL